MEFNCKNCGKCCELNVFVSIEDINRWLDEDRMDILACLTWHFIDKRNPQYLLYIPHKKHIIGHSVLKRFYKEIWSNNDKCIFLHKNRCTIYNTRPESCRKFPGGKLDWPCPGIDPESITIEDKNSGIENSRYRQGQNIDISKNKEILSKVIKKAKEDATEHRLMKLLNGIAYVKEEQRNVPQQPPKKKEKDK